MFEGRRLVRTLRDRRLPLATRVGLGAAGLLHGVGRRGLYGVRYGGGRVFLSHDDYEIDRRSFEFAVNEASYATDYRDTILLDVGAHKGYVGAFAAQHGAAAVITYEPERGNLDVLQRTAAEYRRAGVDWRVQAAAVDAEAGSAQLHVMNASWGHALSPPTEFERYEVGVETVEVVSLADALRLAREYRPELRLVVKVNIEGAECSAILGTRPDAWGDVDEAFVETHPWAACGADELAAHLERAGLTRFESAHPAVLRVRRGGAPRGDRRSGST